MNKNSISKLIMSIITAILGIAVIVMGVLVYKVYDDISVLRNQMKYVSDTSDVILDRMDDLQGNIEMTLEEETSLIESWDIDLMDTDFAKKSVTMDVKIIPKEYTDNTEVAIYFGTDSFILPKNGFSYEAYITLPMDTSYEGNVVVLFVDGKKKSTEILRSYRDVRYDFEHVLSGNLTEMPKYKNGKLSLDGTIDFVLKGKNNQKYSTFGIFLLANNEELEYINLREMYLRQSVEENLPENTHSINVSQDTLEDKEGVRKGSLSVVENPTGLTPVDTEEIELSEEELLAQAITEMVGTYEMKSEYDVAPSTDLRFFLKAVTEDGYTFEYDLFSARTAPEEDTEETDQAEDNASEEIDEYGFVKAENYFAGNYSVYDRKGAKYENN